jgi:hypothetical protein
MITLTEQHREYIINEIVDDINEYQTSTNYYFEDEEVDIRWIDDQESYLVLKGNGTYEWAQPKYIESIIQTLNDASLIKWYCDEHCIDAQEVAEYIEDELETEE